MFSTLIRLTCVASLALTGCDIQSRGEAGNADFTPRDCGAYALGCSFNQPIVVGGTVEVEISSLVDLTGHEVTVMDPTIAAVDPLFQSAGGKNWQITALSAGSTKLVVVDADGFEIDRLTIDTTDAVRLSLAPFLTTAAVYDFEDGVERWEVSADEPHSFLVGPFVSDDTLGMGRFTYAFASATSPELIDQIALSEDCLLSEGCLNFTLPLGTYDLILSTEDGTLTLDAVIEVVEPTR